MRHTLQIAFLAALFVVAGCAQYDRELMGDPQPREAAVSHTTPVPAETSTADSDSMDVGMFNDLDYYGSWHQMDPYGWVWRPNVVMDWQPFVNGHWIWTQYGWMWVDYDPWGWATSHYGYWTMDFALGWVWIPDYTWSPVRCDWMEYGNYIGWCPVAPPGAAFKEPWDGAKAWVWVPVRKFKQDDIGTYRATPKFKSGTDPEVSRGAPVLSDIERKGAGVFPRVNVELDRRVVRNREFAVVKYPPDQQDVIAAHRGNIQPMPNPGGVRVTPTPGSFVPGSGVEAVPPVVGPTQPATPQVHGKSKGTNPPPSSEKKETKFKSRGNHEKKDAGKSKGDSNSTEKGKG